MRRLMEIVCLVVVAFVVAVAAATIWRGGWYGASDPFVAAALCGIIGVFIYRRKVRE